MTHTVHPDGGGSVNFGSAECFKSMFTGIFNTQRDVCLGVLTVCFFENSMEVIYCTVFLIFLLILKQILILFIYCLGRKKKHHPSISLEFTKINEVLTCVFPCIICVYPRVQKGLSSQRKQKCKRFFTMLGRNVQASQEIKGICEVGRGIAETLPGFASPHRGLDQNNFPSKATARDSYESRPRTVRRTHTAVGPEGKQGKAYGVPRMQYVLRKQRAIVLKHMLRQKSHLPLLHCQKHKASGSFPVISRFCLKSFVRRFIQPVVAGDSR